MCYHDDSYSLKHPDDDCSHSGVRTSDCVCQLPSLPLCQLEEGHNLDIKLQSPHGNLADFYFSHKTRGHLVHADTFFLVCRP